MERHSLGTQMQFKLLNEYSDLVKELQGLNAELKTCPNSVLESVGRRIGDALKRKARLEELLTTAEETHHWFKVVEVDDGRKTE